MKNLRCYIQTLFFFLIAIGKVNSQNGKIIDLKPYVFTDGAIEKMEKTFPNTKTVIKNVDFFKIIYLSDGLKVTGYMSVPKSAGKYPSVIFNRGGNRDLGPITDNALIRFFGEISNWGYVVVGSQYR